MSVSYDLTVRRWLIIAPNADMAKGLSLNASKADGRPSNKQA